MADRAQRDTPLGPQIEDTTPRPRPQGVTLQGQHCRIAALDPERDAAPLYAALCGPGREAVWTYMSDGPFLDPEAFRAFLARCAGRADPMCMSIVDLRSGLPIGLASYMRIEPVHACMEVGAITYSPQLQRTIAGTEAMYLMMRHAFSLGYRRYEWKCNALNEPSRRAAQRLGFSYEGIFRQHMIIKGRNRDTSWYAVLDRDWPALEAAFTRWLDATNFDASGGQRSSLSALTRPLLHALDPALSGA